MNVLFCTIFVDLAGMKKVAPTARVPWEGKIN